MHPTRCRDIIGYSLAERYLSRLSWAASRTHSIPPSRPLPVPRNGTSFLSLYLFAIRIPRPCISLSLSLRVCFLRERFTARSFDDEPDAPFNRKKVLDAISNIERLIPIVRICLDLPIRAHAISFYTFVFSDIFQKTILIESVLFSLLPLGVPRSLFFSFSFCGLTTYSSPPRVFNVPVQIATAAARAAANPDDDTCQARLEEALDALEAVLNQLGNQFISPEDQVRCLSLFPRKFCIENFEYLSVRSADWHNDCIPVIPVVT